MIKLFGKSQILSKDEELSFFRNGAVTYIDGKPVKHEPITFKVIGNVQPMNARDLLMVPEHDRFKEQYFLWMENKQFAVKSGLDWEANPAIVRTNDILTRLGANYQVQSVENWGSYTKARIMRLDIGPNATP